MRRFEFQQTVAPAENSNRNKVYVKEIDGQIIKKKAKDIVLTTTRGIVFNPSEAMLLADGWTEYVRPTPPEPTEEQKLAISKEKKKEEIAMYDNSPEVNSCYIISGDKEFQYWANKDERDDLKGAIRDCLALGRETYRLDLRNLRISLTIPCQTLLDMLSSLEVYAVDSYNNTTDHIYAIEKMTTIDEIESYDYKVGYPDKLKFYL